MANKRISGLPVVTSTTTGDVVPIDGVTSRSITVENLLGNNVQSIKDLTSAADKIPYFNGAGTSDVTGFTSFGRSLVDDVDASAARTTLGVAIGNDVQAYNAKLADIAGITYSQGDILYFNGSNIVKLAPGTSGNFLKTQGAAANPIWDSIPGGGDMLAANNLSDVANKTTARSNLSLASHGAAPFVAGLHFRCMKGTGYIVGESGAVSYTANSTAAAGARTVTLNTTPTFVADQLITYLSSDGEYYTAAVKGVASAVVTFKQPLEASIPSGNAVNNFWGDEIHPSTTGYYAMVDYSLREVRTIKRLAYKWVAGDSYIALQSPTQTADSTLSYNNPGSTTTAARKFVATAANDGMKTQPVFLQAGNYIARVALCANTESGSADTASTSVNIVENGVLKSFVGSSTSRCAEILEVPFSTRSGKSISVWITTNAIGTGFSVGQIEIFEVLQFVPDINYGRHVVLGDSYVQAGSINTRLAARLPKATLINAGVSGNTTTQMLARFAADVTAQNPDFVWIVGEGANDYAAAVAVDTFESNVAQMISASAGARADTVVINASIGPKAHSTLGDLLTASRNYVLNTTTGTQAASVDQSSWTAYTPTVTASSGTFTSVSATGRYKVIGKTVFVQVKVTITTVGTASGIVNVTLPLPTAASVSYNLSGSASTGFQITANAAGSNLGLAKYDGTTAISAGIILSASGAYEVA